MPIKALSLWNPWAWLILVLEKRLETRKWSTDYRGPLVICSTQTAPMGFYPNHLELFGDTYERHGILNPKKQLPMGAALCVVQLVDCVLASRVRDSLSPVERAFGDYSGARFAWIMEDVVPFPAPIPWLGFQKLWNWTGPLPGDMTIPIPAEPESQAALAFEVI